MIGFEVRVNGERLATAGIGDLGVLTAILTWVRRDVPARYRETVREEELEFRVGGLLTNPQHVDEHVDWVKRCVAVGDRIDLRVVDTKKIDEPPWRRVEDPKRVERAKRRYYKQLKKKYEPKRKRRKARAG